MGDFFYFPIIITGKEDFLYEDMYVSTSNLGACNGVETSRCNNYTHGTGIIR